MMYVPPPPHKDPVMISCFIVIGIGIALKAKELHSQRVNSKK